MMKTLAVILAFMTLAACTSGYSNQTNLESNGHYSAAQSTPNPSNDAAELLVFGE
ncbi:hypothetical protein H4F18_04200 [Vibrio scophthalmi]|uniref:hypothetical protein n=1 Tax=Vibrio scophthalmi TaxID=45658 RepID=UPI002FF06A1A